MYVILSQYTTSRDTYNFLGIGVCIVVLILCVVQIVTFL